MAQPAVGAVLQDCTADPSRDQDTKHDAVSSSRHHNIDHASAYARYKAAISTDLICCAFVHDLVMLD